MTYLSSFRGLGRIAAAAGLAAVGFGSGPAQAGESWKRVCTDRGQQAYAGCVLRSGKRAVFCVPQGGAPRKDYSGKARPVAAMTYRLTSPAGQVDMRHPAGAFRAPILLRSQRFVRGERTVISFRRGRYAYRYEHGLFGGRDAASGFHGMKVFRNGKRIGTLACGSGAKPAQATRRSWVIVPGVRFGPITGRTTLRDLRRIYGARNVSVRMIQLPHADFGRQRGAVVFPGTAREAKVIFKGRNQGPAHVVVERAGSVWRTDRGLRIGMGLKRLERILGGPFGISGFGRDGGGSIAARSPALRGLYVRLQGRRYTRRMNKPFLSSHPDARRSRLRVSVIWWQPR